MNTSQPTLTPPLYRPLVLIVCTGNTCRSPMAEHLLRRLVEQRGGPLSVASAGTFANPGQPASPEAIEVMREEGLDLGSHRAHLLTQQDVDAADLVLVMESRHKEDILRRFARAKGKIYLLSKMAGQSGNIDDPYGGMHEDYVLCKHRIAELLDKGYDCIVARARGRECS